MARAAVHVEEDGVHSIEERGVLRPAAQGDAGLQPGYRVEALFEEQHARVVLVHHRRMALRPGDQEQAAPRRAGASRGFQRARDCRSSCQTASQRQSKNVAPTQPAIVSFHVPPSSPTHGFNAT